MTRESKMGKVIRLLHQNEIEPDLASPNMVAEFAYNRKIRLTSEEIVKISDSYNENEGNK